MLRGFAGLSVPLLLVVQIMVLSVPAFAEDAAAECDRLVASPYDPDVKAGQGVAFSAIDAALAIPTCAAAVAAAPGDAQQLFQYARALDAGGEAAAAFTGYTKAIAAGSLVAVASLGSLYDYGIGVAEDAGKAADLYRQAADAGLLLGMTSLGSLYEIGRGVPQDYARAAALYKQAADAGSPLGAGSLGYLTERGLGVPADEAEAMRLYSIAADGGEAFAQRNMGLFYAEGRGGLAENDATAFQYFKRAADQHLPAVYIDIAKALRDGVGTGQDVAEAERYLRLGIAEGDAVVQSDARNDLAWLFAQGNRNLEEAEQLARDAVAADPDKALKLDTHAWILHLLGRNAEALPLAERAVALDGDKAAYFNRLVTIKAALAQ